MLKRFAELDEWVHLLVTREDVTDAMRMSICGAWVGYANAVLTSNDQFVALRNLVTCIEEYSTEGTC